MSGIGYTNSELVGLWLQIFASGVYMSFLPRCMVILRAKLREGMSVWLPGVCALIFVLTMMALISNVVWGYQAFATHGLDAVADPGKVYADVASTVSLIRNGTTVALAILSDLIMVYRTFVVWGHSVVMVIVPVLLLLADIVLGAWSVRTLAETAAGGDPIRAEVTTRVRYFFVVTFALNALCAGLICWRIWRAHARIPSQVSRVSDSPVSRALEVVGETAALYCAHLFALIVTDGVGSNVFFVLLAALSPVTALVFTMIIVRACAPQDGGDGAPLSTSLKFWTPGVDTASSDGSADATIDLERTVRAKGAEVPEAGGDTDYDKQNPAVGV
ncbi:hypothetical protein C8Q76DRAFT_404844 [Earliella scabrosa]|nr:hypothetical protein C8Q76DRAFT_404844 [Earliella scabrosa]